MILLSYSNSSIKGTKILGSILYLSLSRPATFVVCNLEENLLFSTLLLGSVFNDYVVLYRDCYLSTTYRQTVSLNQLLHYQAISLSDNSYNQYHICICNYLRLFCALAFSIRFSDASMFIQKIVLGVL